MIRAVAILIDSSGKTVGARLSDGNKMKDISTEQLQQTPDIVIQNAIIDSNGFIRAKKGNLPKMLKKERVNVIEHREMQQVRKLLAQNPLILYHGNKDKDMIPQYGHGEKNCDYGQGFYTTHDPELGKEWAWASYTAGNVGYLHTYELDKTDLKILDLTELDSLHWIAELLTYRTINLEGKEVLQDRIKDFLKKYKLKTSEYDVIIGYRADDSYFTYAEDFVSGLIYKETVENALRYGDLGIQIFIKSKKAFEQLKKVGEPEMVPEVYRRRHKKRKENAELDYRRARIEKKAAREKKTITDFI